MYLGVVTDPKSPEPPGTEYKRRFNREINFSDLAVNVLPLRSVYLKDPLLENRILGGIFCFFAGTGDFSFTNRPES